MCGSWVAAQPLGFSCEHCSSVGSMEGTRHNKHDHTNMQQLILIYCNTFPVDFPQWKCQSKSSPSSTLTTVFLPCLKYFLSSYFKGNCPALFSLSIYLSYSWTSSSSSSPNEQTILIRNCVLITALLYN